jgi:hypothetical protein
VVGITKQKERKPGLVYNNLGVELLGHMVVLFNLFFFFGAGTELKGLMQVGICCLR